MLVTSAIILLVSPRNSRLRASSSLLAWCDDKFLRWMFWSESSINVTLLSHNSITSMSPSCHTTASHQRPLAVTQQHQISHDTIYHMTWYVCCQFLLNFNWNLNQCCTILQYWITLIIWKIMITIRGWRAHTSTKTSAATWRIKMV